MAQNITLLGASYSAVPAVDLPKTGGGTARFTDVTDTTAAASDVAVGKYFYTSSGVKTEGTNSGGGGGGAISIVDEPLPGGGTAKHITGVDISSDTVTAGRLLAPYTAHDSGGNAVTGTIPTKTSSDVAISGATVTTSAGYYASSVSKTVASGTAGTPTATKGSVSNHSISVTPSVTNTTGYITGSTKTGTAVTVSASELVSGTKSVTENGTGIDVTNYASIDVSVPSSSPTLITKNITANGTYNASSDSADGYSSVTVNVSGGGSGVYDWIAAGAQHVTKLVDLTLDLNDTGFAAWTPSTTSSTTLAAQNNYETYSCDRTAYEYYIMQRIITDVKYTSNNITRATISFIRLLIGAVTINPNSLTELENKGTFTSNSTVGQAILNLHFLHYLDSGGNEVGRANYTYGPAYSSPGWGAISGTPDDTTFTFQRPAITAQCHNTYFSTTSAAAVDTDLSTWRWIVDIFRAPRPSLCYGGWYAISDMLNGTI